MIAPAPAMPPPPTALLRWSPGDFVVDELGAYEPSGRGEHLFVTFEKRMLTTQDAVRAIAAALEVDPRGASSAGQKDRVAVARQTASFALPMARPYEAALAALSVPGLTVLSAARHDHKLRPGHLRGNRFRILLRGLTEAGAHDVASALEALGRRGVPNAFGPQRFGRDGANPDRAFAWLSGRSRGPRDKGEQRFLFSSLQSLLFNRVLARREAEGTWDRVLPGDLAKKHDTGGLFLVAATEPEAADAAARAEAGTLSPTGPMFGADMRWPEGAPAALERAVLTESLGDPSRLDAFRALGAGTRRSLRLLPEDLRAAVVGPSTPEELGALGRHGSGAHPPDPRRDTALAARGLYGVEVEFVLTKGGYATTVLGRACHLVDLSVPARAAGSDGDGPADGASAHAGSDAEE